MKKEKMSGITNTRSGTSGSNLAPLRRGNVAGPTLSCRSNVLIVIFAALIIAAMVPVLIWEMQTLDVQKHQQVSLIQKQLQNYNNYNARIDEARLVEIYNQGISQKQQQQQQQQHEEELDDDSIRLQQQPLARGVSGLPMEDTPALIEAQRGRIKCDVNVDFLAYWNDPQGVSDRSFVSPFAVDNKKHGHQYVTFETDSGGWNNIRMSMEIVVVFALATGRTLVMPPKMPLYLLRNDKMTQYHTIGDFYPISKWRERLDIITTEEFLRREGGIKGRMPVNASIKEGVMAAKEVCEFRRKSARSCFALYDHLHLVGLVPKFEPDKTCLVFDSDYLAGAALDQKTLDIVHHFCDGRETMYYDTAMKEAPLIHFAASHSGGESISYRMLYYFYAAMIFTDSTVDNYAKRFVRDFMRYHDGIFCAAGKVVRSIQKEGKERGFKRDEEGAGRYSSLHIRRGDFQFTVEKISAEQWWNNTKELWQPNEILFIATDEKDRTFFDPIAKYHQLRFLDDYWDAANLGEIDPNFLGMVDTIVASRGRVFVGTFVSTFTGYINRMRGFHGMTMKDSYYGRLARKYELHEWADPGQGSSVYVREWPVGWVGIDGDHWIKEERSFPNK